MVDLLAELRARVRIDIPDSQLSEAMERYPQVSWTGGDGQSSKSDVLIVNGLLADTQYTEDLLLDAGLPFSDFYSEHLEQDEGCEECSGEDHLQCSVTSECTCVEYTGKSR